MGILDFLRRKASTPHQSSAESLGELLPRLAPHRRTALLPRTETGSTHLAGSKFGGLPLLAFDEDWPACGNCSKPMQLFLQLCGADLPPETEVTPGRNRILQLFYCTGEKPQCESDCHAWDAPGISTRLRVIEASTTARPLEASPVAGAFPEKRIIGWEPLDDYPTGEELRLLGTELDDVEDEVLSNEGYPRERDKLGGWPFWVQSVSYPECPECRQAMRHLFQIDSNVNLPYMFGDAGTLHLFLCPEHPDRLGMNWDCA